MKLQQKTPKITSTSAIVGTNGASSEVELVELMIIVIVKFDKVCVQSLN